MTRYLLLPCTLVALVPALAGADPAADRVLRLLDGAMSTAIDQSFEYDVVTWEPGKGERSLGMAVKVKTPRWRRVDFLSPGDIRGMKALTLSLSELYIYLPAFHKIRRVAGHVRAQSFMGTALSQDDMSIAQYSDAYTASKILRHDAQSWTLELTRKPGSDFPYPRLEITVLKKERMPLEIGYFNDKGSKIKTEARAGYSCRATPKGQVCNCLEMKMTDHARNGLWTKMIMKKWELNTNIPDRFFTQRDLQRGG
jgi:hypothetical protein